ncbi:MAG: diiron oxygenase [Polyangiales bacterium]
MQTIEYTWSSILHTAERIHWQLDDVISDAHALDFNKPFLPESLARTRGLSCLSSQERQLLNQIRGHQYLYMFGLVEELILPFVLQHERSAAHDDARTRALLGFAAEEAKHIAMFKRFRAAFGRGFPVACEVIGPPEVIAQAVLAHEPLSVALLTLHIEWFVQRHYVDGIKDDADLDPLFRSLLKHHWLDEAQHAKLDTLMVRELAQNCSPAQIMRAVEGYIEIGGMLDKGLEQQVEYDLDALERASGRRLSAADRESCRSTQRGANRWTYLGSGMTHPKLQQTLASLHPQAASMVAAIAPAFC